MTKYYAYLFLIFGGHLYPLVEITEGKFSTALCVLKLSNFLILCSVYTDL